MYDSGFHGIIAHRTLSSAVSQWECRKMASVFISYAAPDRVLALRLAQDMTQFGHQVWLDLWQLGVGASLIRGIGDGLTQADYLIVLLSPHATQSAWMEREWEVLASIEITQRRTLILPVIIA